MTKDRYWESARKGLGVSPVELRVAYQDPAGSLIANHMLRELMLALDHDLTARPETPRAVWYAALAEVAAHVRVFKRGDPDAG